MLRRTIAAVLGVGVLASGSWWVLRPRPITEPTSTPWSTVAVLRTTLRQTTSYEGQIGFGAAAPLAVKATGTITWLPAAGTVIHPGETLLRVDERPVVLMVGSVPQYRALAVANSPSATPTSSTSTTTPPPSPTTGRDVRQLEENLSRFGFRGFTVDDVFTDRTADAVKAWQRSLGLAATGTVNLGDVIFGPNAVRVGAVTARVGDAVGAQMLSVTGLTRDVTASGSPTDLGWSQPGAAVEVHLPSGAVVPGAVSSGPTTAATASDASGGGGGSAGGAGATITVKVADQAALAKGQKGGPVSVVHVGMVRREVLAVPPAALIALAEGGYGVEVVDSASARRSHFVAVTAGMFADGLVEVSGSGLAAGNLVRLPQ